MEGLNYKDHRVLYVDDDGDDRKYFVSECADDFQVLCAQNMDEALKVIEREKICVLVSDNQMPTHSGGPVEDHGGLFLLREVRKAHPSILRALVTGIPQEYRAMPFDLMNDAGVEKWIDKLENPSWHVVVGALLEKHFSENLVGCGPQESDYAWYPGVVGRSRVMEVLLEQIEQISDSGLVKPILITGESGSGKELVAKAVHERGGRRNRPFHVLTKAEISGDTARAALFGYAKGAFTGAYADTAGAFEMAHTGTLFIDDVQNLSWDVQADLLRVLELGKFRRLGAGERERETDIQLICSMNEDPERMIQAGKLRKDFYYRISGMVLHAAPLRDRKDMIPALVSRCIDEFNHEASLSIGGGRKKSVKGIEPEALRLLIAFHWRENNVRELKNTVLSAWINTSTDIITVDDLAAKRGLFHAQERTCVSGDDTPWSVITKFAEKTVERERTNAVLWASVLAGGSVREAAALLGITDNPDSGRVRLHQFLKKHNLQPRHIGAYIDSKD